ncbi:hypothetical protein BSL78_18302 [Apostichopus japonicus]|uniref:Transglutaminase-like domain-containing protein n=1 Tax=Stichopus japonicus TaxID=307972 RepID=A0A2G8KA25_STIJA|nr:hypothetical protein BSL78_18302 [Apostichopus japonicus]
MKSMEERLERERELSDQKLRQKLAARRAQRPTSAVNVEMKPENPAGEDNMSTTQDVQKLEREILMKEATFQAEVEKKRSKMSDADYQRLLAQHRKEIETLRNKLKLSQDRQKQHFQDKLAERRKRRGEYLRQILLVCLLLFYLFCFLFAKDQSVHSITNLEEEIKVREATFQTAVEERRDQLSDEEYRRLLEQHQQEMQDLREKLRLSQERQRQHFQDKLDERRRRRGMISHEQERKEVLSLLDNDGNRLEEDELEQVEKEINDYDSLVESSIAGKKGQISQAEINKLMEEHARNMEDFNGRLAREKQRMLDALREKRAARKLKLESEADFVNIMSILEKNQTKDLETLSEEDLNHLEEDLKKYSRAIHESLESNRGVFSNEELDLMISEHRRNMESLENRLENERLRMEEKMRRKLAMRQAQIVTMVEEEEGETEEVNVAAIYYQDEVSSSSEDEDEDEELEDLPELNQTMAKLVATQFWTTPIQSSDVLIVPLVEEYPVKKKRELYTDPSIFRELDAHAIRLAQTVSLVTQPTFSSLVNELTSIGITELEKARLIFRWITAQNCDEMNLNDVVDDTPLGVLKGLYQKKITFSTLFMRMCRFVGLQCVEITGIAKMKGYTPGTEISFQDPSHHHTWNAVRIDGYWHFLDCNWGVSHIPGSVTFDPFRFEYDEHYFLADPEVIISSHFPNDSSWQLLREAVTLEVFNRAVLLKPDFFKYGFGLQDHTQAVLQAPYGEINIKITCPLGFLLSCRLSEAYSGSEKSSQGILYDQYEFIHQVGDNVMACYVRIPDVGAFHLTLFAKRQFIDGELNVESPTEICRYLIYCHAPSKDIAPLPLAPADHWGPIGVMNAGLVPVSHRTGVIFSQDNRDIHIVFEMTMKMSFYHSLTAWGKDEASLKPYAMQRNVNNQLIVTVAPLRPDRYGLHIFVVYQGHSNPAHLCSYLVVANSARPSVQPFPLLREHEQWGPTKAFDGLELFPISNVDPFIVAEGSILIIEVGHYQQREFMFHFYHEGREMQQDVQMQPANQQCSFVVDLKPKGFFVLKIFAKEAHLQGIPFTHVFNYLIQKI